MSGFGKIIILTIIIVLLGLAAYLLLFNKITDINREFDFSSLNLHTEKQYADTVYIGVISRYSPEKIYEGYQPIMDFLSRKSEYLFELKLSSSYKQTISQLEKGKVTAAFLGTYLFFTNLKGDNLRAVLKPLNSDGKPYFHSDLIVRENSNIKSIKDLKGKRLALPSQLAFSGNWLQKVEFKKAGLKISDFKEVKHFRYHNSVVKQILMGNFDAGVVKDRVANEFLKKGIRVVLSSDPIPGSPIVVSKRSDKKKVSTIINILLNVKKDSIPDNWDSEFSNGFVEAKNEDYLKIKSIITGRK